MRLTTFTRILFPHIQFILASGCPKITNILVRYTIGTTNGIFVIWTVRFTFADSFAIFYLAVSAISAIFSFARLCNENKKNYKLQCE